MIVPSFAARRRPASPPRIRAALRGLLLLAVAACGDPSTAPDGGRPRVDPIDPAVPSAFALVDSAAARGELGADAALVQKILAATGDPRLDARFADRFMQQRIEQADPLPMLLRAAGARLQTMAPDAQRALLPYFIPPAYVGSAWSGDRPGASASAVAPRASRAADPEPAPEPILNPGWQHTDVPGLPVRVWSHPKNAGQHNEITPAAVSAALAKAWPVLTALMARAPLPSDSTVEFTNFLGQVLGDGGSPHFDIYLANTGFFNLRGGPALTIAYPPGCSARPAFMIISPSLDPEYYPIGPTVAHELFHAIQFAFERKVACDDEWDESTAEWASYYVHPRWNPDPYDYLLKEPDYPLYGTIGYWKWLFNAYVQHALTPAVIRTTYERYRTSETAMHALDAALPGGLKARWPEFAVHAWNEAPGRTSFVGWEGVAARPSAEYLAKRAVTVALEGAGGVEGEIGAPPGELTRKYNPVGVTDERVQWFELTNPYAGRARPRVSLQAWVKIRGRDWALEDWSGRRTITFCRARPAERVDSLVLVQADYTLAEGSGERPHLTWEARAQCPDGYNVIVHDWTTSEKYGRTYDVLYSARIATDPDDPGATEMVGTGAYAGTAITRKVNCHNNLPDDERTHRLDGKLEATGSAERPGEGFFGYTLATLDWLLMPFGGRLAETEEEKDAVRGLGSVGSALRPLTLQGGRAERTDTLSRSESDCTGRVFRIRHTVVQRTGGG